jgi:hypothetical protein
MKSQCQVCGESFRGIPLNTIKDGKKVEVCPNCYNFLDDVYKKNSCLACVFFNIDSCELFGTELEEPYLQNLKCEFFTNDPDPTNVARAKQNLAETDIDVLLEQLSKRGQILTYYCCHCGEPLKLGGKNEILKTCPKCKFDLTVINTVKLINQHI